MVVGGSSLSDRFIKQQGVSMAVSVKMAVKSDISMCSDYNIILRYFTVLGNYFVWLALKCYSKGVQFYEEFGIIPIVQVSHKGETSVFCSLKSNESDTLHYIRGSNLLEA